MKTLITTLALLGISLIACTSSEKKSRDVAIPAYVIDTSAYQVGFLIMDGVYNTELTAPYDIFQHTKYRDVAKPMQVFTIAEKSGWVRTFEGLHIWADFSYLEDHPDIDILVVPSAEHHLDSDLENKVLIDWMRKTGEKASYVTSHCDGAFILAKSGLLDHAWSTTFPADVALYKETFPHLNVKDSVLFVHDGKYITSAGGAKSFEAALYLCEHLYGAEVARKLAKGLVIDWDVNKVPMFKVSD